MNLTDFEKEPNSGEILADHMRARVTKDRTNRIHSHPYSEIVLIKSGTMTYSTGEKITRLGSSSIVYNPEGLIHNPFVQYSQVYERYKIKFYRNDLSVGNKVLDELLATAFAKELNDSDFDELYASATRLYHTLERKELSDIDKLYVTTELTSIMLRAWNFAKKENEDTDGYIADVALFINNNITRKLTIEEIANTFFVSKSKLIYDFKAYCNMSINEYITLGKTERAKELLKLGYSVSSVATECGFSTSSYFIKVFSSLIGTTPLKYQIKNSRI